MTIGRYEACIFDLDGVVIDSEPAHKYSVERTLADYGLLEELSLFDEYRGRTVQSFFEEAMERRGLITLSVDDLVTAKQRLYESLFPDVTFVHGFEAFISRARRHFPAIAIVTSSDRALFKMANARFSLERWYDAAYTADDFSRHKPDPEPYLLATARLGVPASRTLVIEDSVNGIRSARAAGCVVVGLAGTFPIQTLKAAGADHAVSDYSELATWLWNSAFERKIAPTAGEASSSDNRLPDMQDHSHVVIEWNSAVGRRRRPLRAIA